MLWLMGILGFVFMLFPFLGIVGLITGTILLVKAKDDENKKKKAIKWLIISGVVFVLGFVFPLFSLLGLAILNS